ncbi:MAG: hypothetical protein JO332_14150 [Planctomycetaceae bacterium]|nr:hypothetical protein [Planctomycetaceae bacterium]
MTSDGDSALIVDLKLAEDARLLFRELGFAMELWEALRLARTEHVTLTCEMERLIKLRRQGRSPSLGGLIIDSIEQVRKTLGPRVRNYRDVLRSSNVAGDSVRLDLLAGLLAQHPTLPTAEEIMKLSAQVDRCRRAMLHRPATEVRKAPAPAELSADLNVDLLEDLRYAEKLRLAFGPASPGIELWEAMTLSLEDRVSAQLAADKLRARREDDGTLVRVLERILDVRTRHSRLAIKLRNYLNHLPIGRYNRELMELAFGFLLASPEGRARAEQWLEDPQRFLREAAIRVEGVIGKAQKYHAALRAA